MISTHRQIIIGTLLAILLLPKPTYGVFGFSIVHDPKLFALELQKKAEEVRKWAETVKFWSDLGLKVGRAVTSLDGLLGLAEEAASMDKKTRETLVEWGKTVRSIVALKQELETLVRSRIEGIRNIQERASRGIFDADANLRDLENYVLNKLGKVAESGRFEQLALFDLQFQRWIEESRRIEAEIAGLNKEKKRAEQDLERESNKPVTDRSPETIAALGEQIRNAEGRISELWAKHEEMTEKIANRAERYGIADSYRRRQAGRARKSEAIQERFVKLEDELLERQLQSFTDKGE